MKQQPTAKLSLVSATKNQNVIHKSVWVITSNIWEPSKTRPTFALNVYSVVNPRKKDPVSLQQNTFKNICFPWDNIEQKILQNGIYWR